MKQLVLGASDCLAADSFCVVGCKTFTPETFITLQMANVSQVVLVYPSGYVPPPAPPPPEAPDRTFPLVFTWNMTVEIDPRETTIEEYLEEMRTDLRTYFAESFGV